MSLLRRVSNGRLMLLLALVVAVAAALGAGIAVAGSSGGGTPPPPASLADAVHQALAAPKPDGVSGRLEFRNRLVSTDALGGIGSSPLLAGGSGRFWITGEGKLRLELQGSDGGGDVQVLDDGTTLQVYDASSHTVYRLQLPARPQTGTTAPTDTVPTVAQIQSRLDQLAGALAIDGPTPTTVGNEGAYDVRLSPKGPSGLLGGAELAWDATHGVPLRFAVYAKGDSTPVLELTATKISFGAVPSSDVQLSPPGDAHVVDLPTQGMAGGTTTKQQPVTGLTAVQAAVPFTLVAPDSLAGRSRTEVRLVHAGSDPAALVVYGDGLDGIAVLESQEHASASAGGGSGALPLPTADLGGGVTAQELPTALGTIVRFEHGGVSFVVAASQPTATVVDAARSLAG